jgi:tetratricopeptide (TPR) repeat protein
MVLPETTEAPSGQFLNWQPGKLPYRSPPGLGWRLEAGSDFIVQLHLHPSGKPESVQPEVGFYFTNQHPTNSTYKIILDWPAIDIPPGATDYFVEDHYVLPVDVQALMIFPHAHYLAREMQAFAVMPNGRRQWLLWIKDWDFNWQGDYRFARPIPLPKGTALHMRFTYDNSTNNVRNPHHPPRRVVFGPQTGDEMGELWLQVLPNNARERSVLAQDYLNKQVEKTVAVNRERLKADPHNTGAQVQLGKALWFQGKTLEALLHLQTAVEHDPNNEEAHYFLGLIFRVQKQFARAQDAFETVAKLNPGSFKAHGNLGLVFLEQGELVKAEAHFLEALRLNPEDVVARQGLETLRRAKEHRLP